VSARPVALVTEIAAPYRIPVFNELARLLDGRLEVIFIAERESRRDWEVPTGEIRFRHRVLGGVQFAVPYRGDRQPVYLAPPLLPLLLRRDYGAVVVGGWNHLECYWSLAYAALRRRRFTLWSETPLLGEVPARPARTALKRLVVSRADSFAVPGPSAARYLVAHGAAPERIETAPNAVDVDFWSAGDAADVEGPRPVLLYSGRLVRSKGVDLALRAYAGSALAGRSTFLVAGDGPKRAELERAAPAGVRFLGSQPREALRSLYRAADLLVFPSRYDPWGLVLNEAACAGLAAIASDGAGATRDLLRDGENGLVVGAGTEAALRAAFDRVAADPELPERLGREALAIARSHTPAACARGLAAAIG
jgi:glycosyltransferase involved in cell wall biosynthesis